MSALLTAAPDLLAEQAAMVAWASVALDRLDQQLHAHRRELAELQGAGVAFARIQTLYPFEVSNYWDAIRQVLTDPQVSAELDSILISGPDGGNLLPGLFPLMGKPFGEMAVTIQSYGFFQMMMERYVTNPPIIWTGVFNKALSEQLFLLPLLLSHLSAKQVSLALRVEEKVLVAPPLSEAYAGLYERLPEFQQRVSTVLNVLENRG
jgi:hypothetical protein